MCVISRKFIVRHHHVFLPKNSKKKTGINQIESNYNSLSIPKFKLGKRQEKQKHFESNKSHWHEMPSRRDILIEEKKLFRSFPFADFPCARVEPINCRKKREGNVDEINKLLKVGLWSANNDNTTWKFSINVLIRLLTVYEFTSFAQKTRRVACFQTVGTCDEKWSHAASDKKKFIHTAIDDNTRYFFSTQFYDILVRLTLIKISWVSFTRPHVFITGNELVITHSYNS